MTKLLALVVVIASALCLSAQTFSKLYDFDGFPNGQRPLGVLTQGRDGNLYGVTNEGGGHGTGEIFRLTPGGTLTVIHSFGQNEGMQPNAGLVLGLDGNLYGTTEYGAANTCASGCGTIFRVSTGGQFATAYRFTGGSDGSNPGAALAMGRDGTFYGSTLLGGSGGVGTVFKWNRNGTFTALHSFSGPDGQFPREMAIGPDSNMYGVTTLGGHAHGGTIFRINHSGVWTKIHDFDPNLDSYEPVGPMVLDEDGSFYGTTAFPSAQAPVGSFFTITPSGAFTLLSDLPDVNAGPLAEGRDGNFYNVLSGNGTAGDAGVLEQITPAGATTSLHTFSGTDGIFPSAQLFFHSNGLLYGSTEGGGVNLDGTLFSLNMGFSPGVVVSPNFKVSSGTVMILGQGLTGTTAVSFNGIPATFTVLSNTYVAATVPAGATTGLVTVTTPGGTLSSFRNFVIF
jgi:uncharacterized repeat protein (TIGR03803 family)